MIIFALIVVCRSSSSPSLQSSAYSSSLFFQHIHSNFTWMLNENDVDVKEETLSEHRFRIWRILSNTHTHTPVPARVYERVRVYLISSLTSISLRALGIYFSSAVRHYIFICTHNSSLILHFA